MQFFFAAAFLIGSLALAQGKKGFVLWRKAGIDSTFLL